MASKAEETINLLDVLERFPLNNINDVMEVEEKLIGDKDFSTI